MSRRVVVEDPGTRDYFEVSAPAARLLVDDGVCRVWFGSTLDALDDATILLPNDRDLPQIRTLVGCDALSPVRNAMRSLASSERSTT